MLEMKSRPSQSRAATKPQQGDNPFLHSTALAPTAQRPKALTVDPSQIPNELKAIPHWLVWRYEWNAKREEWAKIPHQARRPYPNASSTNPKTWTDYRTALRTYQAGQFDGIGFVLTEDLGIVGLDWDKVLTDGTVNDPVAHEEVTRLNTYTERSPSGRGLRAFVFGQKPGERSKLDGRGREIYVKGRFLTITGHRLDEAPAEIAERPEELAELYRSWFPEQEPKEPALKATRPAVDLNLSDEEIIEKAKASRIGDQFTRLIAGDTSDVDGDESRADWKLARLIAFFAQGDPNRVERIMRSSNLYRAKWDESRGRETYLELTIRRAVDKTHTFYSISRPHVGPVVDDEEPEHVLSDGQDDHPEIPAPTGEASTPNGQDAPPALLTEIERLKAIINRQAATITEQRQRMAELEQENAELKSERSAIMGINRNPTIKTEAKTALAAVFAYDHERSIGAIDENGYARVTATLVADNAGITPKRAAEHLDQLEQWGVLEKEVRTAPREIYDPETGTARTELRSETWIRMNGSKTELLDRLAILKAEKPRKWGGSRVPQCPDHPESKIIRRHFCGECGKFLDEEIITPQRGDPEEVPAGQDGMPDGVCLYTHGDQDYRPGAPAELPEPLPPDGQDDRPELLRVGLIGARVWCINQDGEIENTRPYTVQAIVPGPGNRPHARFIEWGVIWPTDHCHPADESEETEEGGIA